MNVDDLAQEIRRVDGSNSLGAGALAEKLMPFLTAALAASPAEPVAVKPLKWRKPTDHPQDDDDAVAVAPGLGGQYSITKESDHALLWDAEDNFVWTQHPSVKDAKAAAQADYERRIRSALVQS